MSVKEVESFENKVVSFENKVSGGFVHHLPAVGIHEGLTWFGVDDTGWVLMTLVGR